MDRVLKRSNDLYKPETALLQVFYNGAVVGKTKLNLNDIIKPKKLQLKFALLNDDGVSSKKPLDKVTGIEHMVFDGKAILTIENAKQ